MKAITRSFLCALSSLALVTGCENRSRVEKELADARSELERVSTNGRKLNVQLAGQNRAVEDANENGMSNYAKDQIKDKLLSLQSDLDAAKADDDSAAAEERAAQVKLDTYKAKFVTR